MDNLQSSGQSSDLTLPEDLKIYINRVHYGLEPEYDGDCDDGLDAASETCQSSAAARMRQLLNCNGAQECSQHGAAPAYIESCAGGGGGDGGGLQASHFLRVDYQCIPGK